jgi:hypothetical protein
MTGKDFMSTTRKNLTKGGSKKDKKAKESFVLQTSYAIKDLFISGRLLYNDPISEYVEKVRREVTASDPQLASETKVFVVKSSVVNAFATNQGYLFITTGLLAQLENEAQLAFVLCHELIHYKKKHVIKAYVQNDKIDRGEGGYRKSEVDKKYLAKSNYSKEHESEADVNGFDLFAKTRYSLDAINGTFDVLKYSELPFEDFEFNHKMLESDYLLFPIDYIQQEVSVVEGEDEEEDDKTSTHPNLAKRRTDIADKISSLEGDDKARVRSNYAISEDLFLNARKLARFDLCHTNLINRQYDRALYQAYCLLKENPDNIYLSKVILKSLYGLTKYANSKRVREVSIKYSKVQGESQKLNYLLDKMESNELNVVALNFAWRLKTKLRHNDTEVNLITEDIFYEMVKRHYPNKSAFSLESRTTPVDTTRTAEAKVEEPVKTKKKTTSSKKNKDGEADDEEDTPKESKTSKLKKKKKVDEKNYFVTYAFVDLLKDKDFVDTYDRLSKQTKKDKTTEKKELSKRKSSKNKKNKKVDDDDDDFDDEENQYLLDEKESVGKYNGEWDTYALGVDKVLIVNPFYLKIDERKKNPVSYSGSEDAQKDFNKKLLEMSAKTGLDVEILDKQEFNSGSVDNYNDMGVLIDWMDERIDHKKLKMLPTDYLRVEDITKKYGTDYLTLMGTINFIEKKRGIGWAIFATIYLFPFSLPFTIPYFINKRSHTYVYTVVFNLKTGQTEMVKIGHAPLKDRYDVMNSFIYDYLQQIKRTGKSKNF